MKKFFQYITSSGFLDKIIIPLLIITCAVIIFTAVLINETAARFIYVEGTP